ncbi:hypothetical protein Aci011_097 [Acinetobacter phage vB_AbaM_B09_Aci01-1]|uniref:Uncharacterized protein n=3 Tax=Saclayvirus TaxID=2733128 RepID=A0A386KMS6_9CAUD|nr:hypothetical protein HOU29_gp084 [Acinetobacter phage vB_AbaM_B09_Aci01-1]YP_009813320.1 hypothetical protein HOU30_gp092 [Acinetobacter phage vB_AbaM_B09_Aci02-2]YP_009813950.1 hypothetical protein HOU35_gp081 [Acinetobacter phage vB_AbaM_B09_Aci05]QMP19066.1 hypothetical protein FKOIJHOC_00118 [Acinetobacter phage Ab_121]QQV88796.1 hypothetical protein Liucustia_96 [Acinetobacter phage Liucustia]UYL86251.1 peptide chain release factor 1 [Acinetobacter phage vB_AbaM_CP14]AYD82416.1 hypoth
MSLKIYDLDDCTFLVDVADYGVVAFHYECDLKFLTEEVEVNNLIINHLSDDCNMSENEIDILVGEVRDHKLEIEDMIVKYWIKERGKYWDEV